VLLLEKVAAAGDQIDLRLLGSFDDSFQGASQLLAVLLSAPAMEAFARQRSVEVQVGEMEQAKGHKSPVTTQNLTGREQDRAPKQQPL